MIVGLSGKIKSGKSYVADALAASHGFVKLSFATRLKQDLVDMGFSYTDVFIDKPPYIRALLQAYGAARREVNPNHWIDHVERSIALCKPGTVFVIDDLRYWNEAEWITRKSGVLVRLQRVGFPPVSDHESETALDDYPFKHVVAGEDGELDDLVAHVEDCLWVEGM